MIRLSVLIVLTLCVAAGLGSFYATVAQPPRATSPGTSPLCRWLDLTEEQSRLVREADPTFSTEAGAMSETLSGQRRRLADFLEESSSSDAQILAQVERVISAHDDLERRVARHLLAIRPHLSIDQQKLLLGLCARRIRQGCRRFQRGVGTEGESPGPAEPAPGGTRHGGG